jgi:hypothetical protein
MPNQAGAWSYGEIAALPRSRPRHQVKPEQQKTSEFRLIGNDVTRVELPGKVNGSAQYSIDVQLPGMIYGVIYAHRSKAALPRKSTTPRRARSRASLRPCSCRMA